ncbi:MAG: glycosyltransferase, partial [Methylobacterium mesophilicum]|nr:glycosyltransferase [Methylobacterium mesophilicum]
MSVALDMRDSAPARQPASGGGLGFTVLYALDSFPQLSESYINAEIERMKEWGVHIEVWSKDDPKSEGRHVDVKVHRGALVDTIARIKPDIVHTHWTQTALKYKDAAKRNGVPMTARGHWHFVPKQLERIENEETIVRLFMFPHLAAKYGSVSSKIQPMHSCFHHEWLAPQRRKNRKMIMRTAACKKPKGLHDFVRIASKLPDYRAVMILCSLGPNALYRELEEFNRSLGSPVEMLHDITYEEVAAFAAEAGIYVHTYDPDISFGMPVSIAETMAAGCTVIARDVLGARDYAGDAGRYYTSEDEAVALV